MCHLSAVARERLRLHLAGDREVTEENRPAYRELVAARIMIPVHSFVGGREAAYRLTYWGWNGGSSSRESLARKTMHDRMRGQSI